MPRIFNRDLPEYDIYDTALQDAEICADDDLRAIAINLRCDPRVTEERELKFRKIFNGDIEASLNEYFEKRIHGIDLPDFCQNWCKNLIADCSSDSGYCCEGFNKDIDLATVVNLNAFQKPIKEADDNYNLVDIVPRWLEMRDLDITEALENPRTFSDWLDIQLTGEDKDSPKAEKIITTFFEIINYELNVNKKHFKPMIWVTDWGLFKQYTENFKPDGSLNVDRWNQVVGVNRTYPSWQIVIKYHSSNVDVLYRPCQLDGDFYPQHFPPPPNAEFSIGGHTVDLASRETPLLP
jgi:hypothetical protein